MTKEHSIETIVNPNAESMGRPAVQVREVKLTYTKGRGIVIGVWTAKKQENWRTTNLFGDGNTQVLIAPMTRIKPSVLAAMGARLEANADQIHAGMKDWHDDSIWSKESRAAWIAAIAPVLRGESESIAA